MSEIKEVCPPTLYPQGLNPSIDPLLSPLCSPLWPSLLYSVLLLYSGEKERILADFTFHVKFAPNSRWIKAHQKWQSKRRQNPLRFRFPEYVFSKSGLIWLKIASEYQSGYYYEGNHIFFKATFLRKNDMPSGLRKSGSASKLRLHHILKAWRYQNSNNEKIGSQSMTEERTKRATTSIYISIRKHEKHIISNIKKKKKKTTNATKAK